MAQTLLSSAPQQHNESDKPPSIRFDVYQDASPFPENTVTSCHRTLPLLVIPNSFQHKKRSQSCHPRFQSAATRTGLPSISATGYTATADTISQRRTQQWLNKCKETEKWECTMADRTVVVVEDVEISSDEDDLDTTSLGLSSGKHRVHLSFDQESARGRRSDMSPDSSVSGASLIEERVGKGYELEEPLFEEPFDLSEGEQRRWRRKPPLYYQRKGCMHTDHPAFASCHSRFSICDRDCHCADVSFPSCCKADSTELVCWLQYAGRSRRA